MGPVFLTLALALTAVGCGGSSDGKHGDGAAGHDAGAGGHGGAGAGGAGGSAGADAGPSASDAMDALAQADGDANTMTTDTGVDTSGTDAVSDAHDGGADVQSVDLGSDAGSDAASDARSDTGSDVHAAEAGTDASTSNDGRIDAGSDVHAAEAGADANASPDGRTDTVGEAGSDATESFPAPHGAAPKFVTAGGPVLAHPLIVPVFFAADDPTLTTKVEDFEAKLGATQYWKSTTFEYGVGAATAAPAIQVAETAPNTITDDAVQAWLKDKILNDPDFPNADPNELFVLHYPAATTVSLGTSKSCQAFGFYHSDFMAQGQKVAYAVIPRCPDYNGFTGIDAATLSESDVLVSAATDPYPLADPAYSKLDDAHLYWSFVLAGGEVTSLCSPVPGTAVRFAELPYTVQRSWSNAAAAASHDPCVPALANDVYFNTAPVLPDDVTTPALGASVKMKGVTIAVGATKTIELDLFSDAATSGPWTIAALDGSTLAGGASRLDLTVGTTTGKNGDKLSLTIKVKSAGTGGLETFLLTSKLGADQHFWVGAVGN